MKQRGFTIIELLVVVIIVIIFPAVVIANFPHIKLQFAISRTVHAFAQNVRKAQDMALSSMPYRDSFGFLQPVDGYGIYLDIDKLGDKKYILYADRQPGDHQYDPLDYIIFTVDLEDAEPGVVIKEIRNVFGRSASINFAPPNPDTTLTRLNPKENALQVVFALAGETNTVRTVLINTAGLVEVK